MMDFDEVIDSRARLRELYPAASQRAARKVAGRVDDLARRFIAASPFVLVATRGEDGRLDISPKGDPAGFVRVLDPGTLAIPDRPGNNRLDTFENLLSCPEVALIFMIPGHRDTLRVSGRGRLVRDRALQAATAVNGREPSLVLVVEVEEVYGHCPKCAVRSGLWSPNRWPDLTDVPSLAELMVTHGTLEEIGVNREAMQEIIDRDGRERLY
jgi:PPOX class probable FMN-dependent enzyme